MIIEAYRSPPKRTVVFFEEWMEQLAILLRQYLRFDPSYNPFSEDELPGVSVLLAAGTRANFLPMAEHWTEKLSRSDYVTRVRGRGDLWLARADQRYSFEFKRSYTDATTQNLQDVMGLAVADLDCLTGEDCEQAFAGVIAPCPADGSLAIYEQYHGHDFAFAVGGRSRPDVFLYFRSW